MNLVTLNKSRNQETLHNFRRKDTVRHLTVMKKIDIMSDHRIVGFEQTFIFEDKRNNLVLKMKICTDTIKENKVTALSF